MWGDVPVTSVSDEMEYKAVRLLGPGWQGLLELAFGDVPGLTPDTLLRVVEAMELSQPGSGLDWVLRHAYPDAMPRLR
jgi:hypothetical protein